MKRFRKVDFMHKNGKNGERETEMYLCGEEYEKDYQATGDYFSSIVKFFGLKKLREAHSGDLNEYLYWLVIGTIFIIIATVLLWA